MTRMSSISIPAEFTLHRKNSFNRTSAPRWIASHIRPYLWIVVMLIVGAIGNAALAAYVGVAPLVNHSGKRQPLRGPACTMGDAELRAKLWMPTLQAIRRNAWLKPFYERLVAAGKPKKVAIVASMRKLLGAMVSVARTKTPFVPRLVTEAATG